VKIKRGSTSVRRLVFVADTSQTNGAGLANLVFNSSGLVAYYIAGDSNNEVQITLVSATLGTFTSGGFVAVDNTNMPGWYEIGIPDAALDGGNEVAIQLRGATNMAPVNVYIELDAVDYQTDAFGALKPTTAGRTLDVSAGGEAGIDLANVGSPTTTLNLSGVSIKAVTDGVTVSDKTGFKLASDGLAQVTAWTVAITGNITGNVTGSVGSISGVTFPAYFGSLGINSSGHISRVTLVDTTTTNTDMRGTDGAALASAWTATRAGYLDSVLLAEDPNKRTVKVTGTGSGHIAADIHDLQPAVINNTHFAAGAIDANALASDAATEIANAVAATQALSRLDSMIESDGAGQFRFDTIALSMAPAGGGGGGTDWTANERTAIRSILGIPTSGTTPTDPAVGILDEIRDDINAIGINVYPVSASTPERVQGTTLTFYRNESRSVSVVTDFTLTSLTLQFTVEDADGLDVYTLANGSISRSGQTFTVAVTTAVTGNLGQYRWSMRDVSGGGSSVIAMGVLTVQEAASNV
jgi:hypothetical protein